MARKKRPTTGLSLSAGEKAVIDWLQKKTGIARKPMILSLARQECSRLGGDPGKIEADADKAAQ